MTLKTKASHGAAASAHSHPRASGRQKVSTAGWIATAFGVGYIPLAPGTCGALVGVVLYWVMSGYLHAVPVYFQWTPSRAHFVIAGTVVAIVIAAIGVWSSHRTADASGMKDPSFVVIDEVSGQFLTYLIALSPANWKYLLLGFILFRAFDIWKPFPARQAESLPGGWGIMTDDWIAGVYAGAGLWIARGFGL